MDKNSVSDLAVGSILGFCVGLLVAFFMISLVGCDIQSKPDLIVAADLLQQDSSVQDLSQPDLSTPDLTQPDLVALDYSQPDLSRPDLVTLDYSQPDLSTPDLTQLDLVTLDYSQPDLITPDATVLPPDLSPPCGLVNEACCPDGSCAEPSLYACSNGTCIRCGLKDKICCNWTRQCSGGECFSGYCRCGGYGQLCCGCDTPYHCQTQGELKGRCY